MYEDWSPVEEAKTRAGGQGTVRKVRHHADGRVGALKELHPDLLRDTERRQRMAREVLALQQVQGEGIPTVLDHNMDFASEIGVPLYFVSRWIAGPTLQQYAGGRPCSIDEALKVTRDLATIVSRCHGVGVYHRDIKPDNVIIDQTTLTPILVDFGTAWAKAEPIDAQLQTEIGQELGNRFLRIPDLAAGRERRDPRADITLLVGILFFVLTGRTPRVLVDENMRPPHETMSDAFPEAVKSDSRWPLVRRIFHIGFQPDVNQRFQTADDLIERINEVLIPAEHEEPATGYQDELTALNELLGSAMAREMQQIERSMLQASRKLEDRLEAMANANGLMSRHLAGRATVIAGGQAIEFHYGLCRREAWNPEASVTHRVELVGENRSYVQATYHINAQVGAVCETGHYRGTYYRGPAADTERLEEELMARAEEIFGQAVDVLRRKLRAVMEGSDN